MRKETLGGGGGIDVTLSAWEAAAMGSKGCSSILLPPPPLSPPQVTPSTISVVSPPPVFPPSVVSPPPVLPPSEDPPPPPSRAARSISSSCRSRSSRLRCSFLWDARWIFGSKSSPMYMPRRGAFNAGGSAEEVRGIGIMPSSPPLAWAFFLSKPTVLKATLKSPPSVPAPAPAPDRVTVGIILC